MPSSHSQFMGFFVVYAIIFLFFKWVSRSFLCTLRHISTLILPVFPSFPFLASRFHH